MLKKLIYFKSSDTGLRVESLFGNIYIGLNKKITPKNFKQLPCQLIKMIKEYKEDGSFRKMKISSHLLIDRDLVKKNTCKNTSKVFFEKGKTNFVDKKYLKIIKIARRLKIIKMEDIQIKTIKISLFKKYLFFSSMKLFLFLINLKKFKYYSVMEIKTTKNSPYLYERITQIEKYENSFKKQLLYYILSIKYAINKITFNIPEHNFMGSIEINLTNSR